MADEPTIADVHKTMTNCSLKVDKVIVGLYGSLDEPGSGFINETKTDLKSLNGKVKILLDERKERKDDKKWTLRAAISAVVGTVVALVKTFFFNGNVQTP